MITYKYVLLLLSIIIQFGCTSDNRTLPKAGTIQEYELLEAFFNDPVANFNKIKNIPDLCEQILNYDLSFISQRSKSKPYVARLFEKNFHDISEDEMHIVIYLYMKLGHCQGDVLDGTRAAFRLKPALFVKVLEETNDWKSLVTGLSQDWESFSLGLGELGSSAFEKEVQAYAYSLHEANEKGLSAIEAFLTDPVTNFDRIKGLGDIGDWLGKYEQRFVKDRRQTRDVIGDFFYRNFTEISEKKIEILIFLIENSGSGIYGEMFIDKADDVFCDNTKMFVGVLGKNKEWKKIIYELDLIGDISRCLEKMGNSQFENEIRAYIKGLSVERRTGPEIADIQ